MKLVYDLASIPKQMSIEEFLMCINNEGIVLWDSTLNGKPPVITPESKLEIIDISKDLTGETL